MYCWAWEILTVLSLLCGKKYSKRKSYDPKSKSHPQKRKAELGMAQGPAHNPNFPLHLFPDGTSDCSQKEKSSLNSAFKKLWLQDELYYSEEACKNFEKAEYEQKIIGM